MYDLYMYVCTTPREYTIVYRYSNTVCGVHMTCTIVKYTLLLIQHVATHHTHDFKNIYNVHYRFVEL